VGEFLRQIQQRQPVRFGLESEIEMFALCDFWANQPVGLPSLVVTLSNTTAELTASQE